MTKPKSKPLLTSLTNLQSQARSQKGRRLLRMLLLHPQRTKAKEKKRKVRAELVVRAINGMRMIAKASLVCISVMMHAQKVMIVHTSTIWHFDWLKLGHSSLHV